MAAHRAASRVSPEVLGAGLLVSAVLLCAGLALTITAALTTSMQAPAATVRVPGPTVTVSYLLIRTATPGAFGY